MSSSECSDNSANKDRVDSKRKRCPQTWKKTARKQARLHGEQYVSGKGKLVEKKVTGSDCTCKKKCMSDMSEAEKLCILTNLYQRGSKDEQDTFLLGQMECHKIARSRPMGENKQKNRTTTFSYFILKGSERLSVCKTAFLSLHSISNSRLQRLNRLMISCHTPKDLRGKHNNRPHVVSPETIAKMKCHIESFPTKVSHYSSKEVHYLDASLNVKAMHDLFTQKYIEEKDKVKYEFYLKFFRENFNLRFGRPQVDVCGECEQLSMKLKDRFLNDNAKRVATAEMMVHKRRANKFYSKLKEIKGLCQERKDVGAIVFDYIQNMPLPVIPVQEMFYYRQLWLYGFEIHDLRSGTGHFYTYHEGQALKGPNEVCSFIYDYIQKLPLEIQELHVFSDGCPGQNRNHTVTRFFLYLAQNKRFRKIYQYFPVRGHSFLPCDRDFGNVKRVIRRHDRIYLPEEYEDIILSSRKQIPFKVSVIKYTDVTDFKNWWPQYYKKTCKSIVKRDNETFAVSTYNQLIYDSSTPGYISASRFIGGLVTNTFKLLKSHVVPTFPNEPAYKKPLPINTNKINDIKKVLKYMDGEILEFYYHITSWETSNEDLQE